MTPVVAIVPRAPMWAERRGHSMDDPARGADHSTGDAAHEGADRGADLAARPRAGVKPGLGRGCGCGGQAQGTDERGGEGEAHGTDLHLLWERPADGAVPPHRHGTRCADKHLAARLIYA